MPTVEGRVSYIYGPDGLPLSQIAADGTTRYFHHDQIGSARLLTSSTGVSIGTFSYDPYGNLTGSTGTAATPLGYAGQYRDADTGLIYLRARHYDPRTGQFVSRDPLFTYTAGVYGYADADPLNTTDPTGLWDVLGVHIPSPSLQQVSDFAAGFGDSVTFGGTKKIREAIGVNDSVDFCSGSYRAGEVTGTATAAAAGYGGVGTAGRLAATRTFWGNRLFGRVRPTKFGPVGTGPPGAPAVKGTLNGGDLVRVGMSWKGSAQDGKNIFRIAFGGKNQPFHFHLDFLR